MISVLNISHSFFILYTITMSNLESNTPLMDGSNSEKSHKYPKESFIHRIWNAISAKREEKKRQQEELMRQQEEERKLEELRKKQAEKRRQLEEKRRLELYKEFVDWEVKNYIKPFVDEINMKNERIREKNITCPNCGSKNVVNRIWNTVWEVHWNVDWEVHWRGSVFGGIFGVVGSSYLNWHVYWNVDWKTETLPVSHCNNCSNEWYKEELKSTRINDVLKYNSYNPYLLVRGMDKYLMWKYDDILIDDEKEREERAYQTFLDDNEIYFKNLKGLSIETLAYLYKADDEKDYYGNGPYKYRFPLRMVEILQKLWFKYWFEENQ